MAGQVMSSIQSIDVVLTQKDFDIEGMQINGKEWHSIPREKAVLLPTLIMEVWKKNERRLNESLNKDGRILWVHKSRE